MICVTGMVSSSGICRVKVQHEGYKDACGETKIGNSGLDGVCGMNNHPACYSSTCHKKDVGVYHESIAELTVLPVDNHGARCHLD